MICGIHKGHMVPTYKPAATFAFMKAWLRDEDYPAFDANCTSPSLHDDSGTGTLVVKDKESIRMS